MHKYGKRPDHSGTMDSRPSTVHTMPDNALQTNVQGTKLELSLLNLDLLDLASSQSPLRSISREIFKWLGRERINENDFKYCVERTAGIAYPNENGNALRDRIFRNDRPFSLASGVACVLPGAIGRWMALDPEHAYLVTTTVIWARFQQLSDVPELLCEMIMSKAPTEATSTSPPESVIRMRLLRVLSKVVDSIALNVVNVGHDINEFPEELQKCCQRHLCKANDFAKVTAEIQKEPSHLLLLCDRFPADLTLWILNHYDGSIEITMGSKITYTSPGMDSTRRLEIFVFDTCPSNKLCHEPSSCEDSQPRIKLCEEIYRNGKPVLSDRLGYEIRSRLYLDSPPAKRQSLYNIYSVWGSNTDNFRTAEDLPSVVAEKPLTLTDSERKDVISLAKDMVYWIVMLPVKFPQNHDTLDALCLRVDVWSKYQIQDPAILRLGELFTRSPGLLNLQVMDEEEQITADFFSAPEPESIDYDNIFAMYFGSEITERFPSIARLVSRLRQRCKCTNCLKKQYPSVRNALNRACLATIAVTNLTQLVGNAIADGFGVTDMSGMTIIWQYSEEVHRLICLLSYGVVEWHQWLRVAISTAFGTDSRICWDDCGIDLALGAQRASMVALVRWLDSRHPLTITGMFSLEFTESCLEGVEDESSLVRSYEVSAKSHESTAIVNWEDVIHDIWDRPVDENAVRVQHAALGSRESYQLLSIAAFASVKRVFNPGVALASLFRQVELPNMCSHSIQDVEHAFENDGDSKKISFAIYDFADVLSRWDNEGSADEASCQFTHVLDTPLKVNIALSLCPNTHYMLIKAEKRPCLQCVVETVKEYIALGETLKIIVDGTRS